MLYMPSLFTWCSVIFHTLLFASSRLLFLTVFASASITFCLQFVNVSHTPLAIPENNTLFSRVDPSNSVILFCNSSFSFCSRLHICFRDDISTSIFVILAYNSLCPCNIFCDVYNTCSIFLYLIFMSLWFLSIVSLNGFISSRTCRTLLFVSLIGLSMLHSCLVFILSGVFIICFFFIGFSSIGLQRSLFLFGWCRYIVKLWGRKIIHVSIYQLLFTMLSILFVLSALIHH